MKYFHRCVLILLVLAAGSVLSGCADRADTLTRQRYLMGTTVAITAYAPEYASQELVGYLEAALDKMARIEHLVSAFDHDSEIARLKYLPPGTRMKVSPETFEIIAIACQLGDMTGGAFDITVAPLLENWGFYDQGANASEKFPRLKEQKYGIGYKNIILHERACEIEFAIPGIQLDLGGIAKGYCVDAALAFLQARGITSVLINAGGDIYCAGHRPNGQAWQVGIQHPRSPKELIGTASVIDKAIVSSGDYENYIVVDDDHVSHIMDARAGRPARTSVVHVTVVADTCVWADGLATALMVMGQEQGMALVGSLPEVEALMVIAPEDDGQLTAMCSAGFRQYARIREDSLAKVSLSP